MCSPTVSQHYLHLLGTHYVQSEDILPYFVLQSGSLWHANWLIQAWMQLTVFCRLLKVSRSPRYMTQDDDSEQNKRLPFKAEDQLRPGRHDEWSLFTGHAFTTPAGPSWGGGMGDMDVDDRTREMIYRQQQR